MTFSSTQAETDSFDEKSIQSSSADSEHCPEKGQQHKILQSCTDGDLPVVKELFDSIRRRHGHHSDNLISRAMVKAIENTHPDVLTYLVSLQPRFETLEDTLRPVHDAVFASKAGLEFWIILHQAYPIINDWDLDDGTDHLGAVAVTGQVAFAEYLIYNGCDARWARYNHVPILKHMQGNNPALTKGDRKYIRLRDNRWKWPWFKPIGMRFLRPCDPGEKDWTPMIALLREHGASDTELPPQARSWLGKTWQASRVGNIDRLKRLLDEKDNEGSALDDVSIGKFIVVASEYHHATTLAYLIDRFPNFPDQHEAWSLVHDDIFGGEKGGLETYKVLLRRQPDFVNWHCGLRGDHLTQIAMADDLDFAKFLLENEYDGDASRARFVGRSVLNFIDGPRTISKEEAKGSPWLREHRRRQKAGLIPIRRRPVEMIRLLESHGAVNTRREKTRWERFWED